MKQCGIWLIVCGIVQIGSLRWGNMFRRGAFDDHCIPIMSPMSAFGPACATNWQATRRAVIGFPIPSRPLLTRSACVLSVWHDCEIGWRGKISGWHSADRRY
jgi:hypothetical protein